MQTRIYTLDNGLKVFLSVNTEKPRIQTYIAVRTGSKNDPAETTGLAHYLEHLMFKGTRQFGTTNPEAEEPLLDEIERRYEVYRKLTDPEERRKAYHGIDSVSQVAAQYFIPNEYDKLMAAIGAKGTNAYTSNDVTCYTEDIPSNEVDNWARIQADRFQNMVIRGFHTELEAVYEEYNIGLSNDTWKLYEAIYAMLWPNHPYGTQTTIGTQEHLKNPSITNIKIFQQVVSPQQRGRLYGRRPGSRQDRRRHRQVLRQLEAGGRRQTADIRTAASVDTAQGYCSGRTGGGAGVGGLACRAGQQSAGRHPESAVECAEQRACRTVRPGSEPDHEGAALRRRHGAAARSRRFHADGLSQAGCWPR